MTIWTILGGALLIVLFIVGIVLVVQYGMAEAERRRAKREAAERRRFIENEIRKSGKRP